MHFVAIGLNVGNAPLELREQLSFTGESLAPALAALRAVIAQEDAEISEAVIISTCQRVELIALVRDVEAGERALIRFLASVRDVPADAFTPHLSRWHDEAAIAHVFHLAAGLDSPVLGDSQVLGQTVEAYDAARAAHTAGPMLAALFQHTTRAGKRIHSETLLNRHVSVGTTAAALVLQTAGADLGGPGRRALVIGAGKMGEWATDYLHTHGMRHILIANRRLPQSAALAERVGGIAVPWEELHDAITCADVVISTTAAPTAILTYGDVTAIMARRPGRPLHFIDIAVPRDIAPDVAQVPDVRVTTVDDLPALDGEERHERAREVPAAEAIIAAEMAAFDDWLHARAVSPTISEIRAVAEGIRQSELDHFLGRTHDFTVRDARQIEALTRAIVNKLLHQPTIRLKAMSTAPEGVRYAEVARDLFGLVNYPHAEVIADPLAMAEARDDSRLPDMADAERLDTRELPVPVTDMALTTD